ncbi:hypothetical protein ACJJTC_005002 [Scirpophaga incertulas]
MGGPTAVEGLSEVGGDRLPSGQGELAHRSNEPWTNLRPSRDVGWKWKPQGERRQHELDLRRLELEAQRDRTINRLADALVNFTEVPGPSPVPLKSLRIAKAFFFVLAFQSMNSEPQRATESKRLKTFMYKLY